MSEEEFEAWHDQCACDGNFGGSSSSMVLFGITVVFATCVTKIKNCTNPQKNMNNGKKQKSTKNGTTVISQGRQIVIVL